LKLGVDVMLKIDIQKFKEVTEVCVVNLAAEVEIREWSNLDDLKVSLPES
jgi:hypothetical protein